MHARPAPRSGRPSRAEASGRPGDPGDASAPGRSRSPREALPTPPPLPFHARQVAAVIGLLLVVWIVLVFARAVAATSAARDRAASLRADNAAQEARLAAEQDELTIVQGQPFVRLQARAYGLGSPGERPFSLAADAPSPRPITPLGAPPVPSRPPAPVEAWLDLLFGP